MRDTRPLLLETDFPPIKRDAITTLQVNLGYLCNLSCTHCHVNAGPNRTELMDKANIDLVLNIMAEQNVEVLDLTGGAPEMNPHFRYLVEQARALGVKVIDRCNLTILMEPGYEDLGEFLAANEVEITASLPCYVEENVDSQRGKGVYSDSILALQRLNRLGYGVEKNLQLNLVYNPTGPHLPPAQETLQEDYKRELKKRYDILFDQLFVITNMPISRFGAVLLAHQQFDAYMQLLKDSYCSTNLSTLMCRSMVSVDWQGYLYDCDFNQMLDLPLVSSRNEVLASDKPRLHLSDLRDNGDTMRSIVVGEHCYGCTAGQGSSCGGALD